MATISITEFAAALAQGPRTIPAGMMDGNQIKQSMAITGGSTQSTSFAATTRMIRVFTDSVCSIDIGPNPTAVAGNTSMSAGNVEYFGVLPGHKLAVIGA